MPRSTAKIAQLEAFARQAFVVRQKLINPHDA